MKCSKKKGGTRREERASATRFTIRRGRRESSHHPRCAGEPFRGNRESSHAGSALEGTVLRWRLLLGLRHLRTGDAKYGSTAENVAALLRGKAFSGIYGVAPVWR